MKSLRFPTWLFALTVPTFLATTLSTQAAARLLPFQGRLSDANGAAVSNGARVVQFKMYDAPVGGRTVWNGEVQKLTVNAGLVSTILGSKASLSIVDFNQDLYLEITIDANGDGQITIADPPLLPRQSIFPAVFAHESANTRALGGYDWSPLFGTNNPADGTLLPSKVADGSLTTAKLQDGAISAAKIAAGAITPTKLNTTGASAGQSLTYDGNQVVWNQVNALDAETLDGFDWATIFTGADPQAGELNVAGVASRGGVSASGNLNVAGRTFLLGPSTTVNGLLFAAEMTSNTDVTAFRDMWARSFNQSSDRNAKENFDQLDVRAMLDKVLALPISRWNYKDDPKAKHIGPVAQDFRAAFSLGSNDKSIATVDADGVALTAIQGLNNKVEERVIELRALLKTQQDQIETLRVEIAALKAGKQ